MEKELQELLNTVQAKLAETSGPIKQAAEDALKQAKETGILTAENKAAIDKMLMQQNELVSAQDKLTDRLENLDSRNQELEQELAARGSGGAGNVQQTLGQAFVANESVQSFMETGRGTATAHIQNAILTTQSPRWPDEEGGVIAMPRRQVRIRNLLSPGSTASDLVKYRKQTVRTNAAANRAEGAASAESAYEWAEADAPVRSVTHHINVSKESYSDADYLSGEIDTELRYGLALKEDTQLLTGDGVGQNLSGLITNATAYAAPITIASPTMIDIIRLGLLQASLADHPADGIVLHPNDWAWIELLKDAENRYIFTHPQQETGPRLWGRPVVETQSITEDKFLVGAFRSAATIYDRKDVEVLISSEHSDNFIKGMLTIQADERLAMAVKRPAALTFGDLGRIV